MASPTENDRALFLRAVAGTRPLPAANRVEASLPPPPEPRQRRLDESAALDASLTAAPSLEDRLDSGEESAFLRPGLRRRVLVDLRRGRWATQDKIDLHGLTRDEARAALSAFVAAALAQGKRCVRVIHGKGLGSPGGVPVLKQLSRGWLAQREDILAFCQANPHEGGSGALLVLLRAAGAGR
ncbi:MAG: Smr/MutS family protein [Azoarcus sp.]|jgi:DNA-nicking Smr family endonuclease|nr:Smr/MutS family protein [Azoarcus sp.]